MPKKTKTNEWYFIAWYCGDKVIACFKSGHAEALWHTQYMQQWLGGIQTQTVSEQYVVLLTLNRSAIRCIDCIPSSVTNSWEHLNLCITDRNWLMTLTQSSLLHIMSQVDTFTPTTVHVTSIWLPTLFNSYKILYDDVEWFSTGYKNLGTCCSLTVISYQTIPQCWCKKKNATGKGGDYNCFGPCSMCRGAAQW